ncbi:MAG: AAA family ATPase [Sterolibacteriaceae bacterium]|nr:AAA family ATPase [Sterolibacteriaceae bacterium]
MHATPPLSARLRSLIDALSHGLVERTTPVRLALLAALTGEHLLLIGPPGTAKSELARRLHRAFRDAAYFERLLTRFSVPEELFGPLSIAALEQDRYERQTAGFLPQATIAFIDEVFKANSAILNALLTLLNEREFDNGAQRIACPLISVIGASNEVPQDEALAAFHDRFLLRLSIVPVSDAGFPVLLRLPSDSTFAVDPALQIAPTELSAFAAAIDAVSLPEPIVELIAQLRGHLAGHDIAVSDRRWHKTVRLLKASALSNGRDAVGIWDLWLTQFCATAEPVQAGIVAEWYLGMLGVQGVIDPARFGRVVEAFEAQLEIEQNANDLNYDEQGVLTAGNLLDHQVSDAKGASAAPRLSPFLRTRRYGATHTGARVAQVQSAIDELGAYLDSLDHLADELAHEVPRHLWIAPEFAQQAALHLAGTRANIVALQARAHAARNGYAALPRLAVDSRIAPEPVVVD